MKEIVITLVFSIVLLLVTFYPAIKIMELVEKKKELSQRMYTSLTLFLTVILALLLGGALSFL